MTGNSMTSNNRAQGRQQDAGYVVVRDENWVEDASRAFIAGVVIASVVWIWDRTAGRGTVTFNL